MPQDSVEVNDTFPFLTDSASILRTATDTTSETDKEAAMWVVFILGLFFLLRYFIMRKRRLDPVDLTDRTLADKLEQYRTLLQQHNPYFRRLSPPLQNRFLTRLVRFILTKKFHYVDIEPEGRIPVLVSAAAIQITFGLDEFHMSYFDNIYVLRSNYHFGLSHIPYEGHVNSLGIYLSWSNFEAAFSNYEDGNNVGLHEMAHALAYVNFNLRVAEDNEFRRRFYQFSETGRPLFNAMQQGAVNMLGTYASTNYHEFWAVCVENFFERSGQLKEELPELYHAMTVLLQQDPLSDNLLINSVE
jgi:MtfA peptidase